MDVECYVRMKKDYLQYQDEDWEMGDLHSSLAFRS